MSRFLPLENSTVLLRQKGTYRETSLHVHEGKLFAKKGTGFIRLLPNNGTTDRNVSWSEIWIENGTHRIVKTDVIWVPQNALAAE
jgi:hypothetical protein